MTKFVGILVFVFATVALLGLALIFERFIRQHDEVVALAKRDRERQKAARDTNPEE